MLDDDNTLYAAKGTYVVQVNGDDLARAQAEAVVKPVLAALPSPLATVTCRARRLPAPTVGSCPDDST